MKEDEDVDGARTNVDPNEEQWRAQKTLGGFGSRETECWKFHSISKKRGFFIAR